MKVFIRYSQSDKAEGRKLAADLTACGVEVFDPEAELGPGDNWALAIGKALERSDAMVVLVSPESIRDPYVVHEIGFALGNPRYANRLFAVELKPTRGMPWILRKLRLVRPYPRSAVGRKRFANEIENLAEATA